MDRMKIECTVVQSYVIVKNPMESDFWFDILDLMNHMRLSIFISDLGILVNRTKIVCFPTGSLNKIPVGIKWNLSRHESHQICCLIYRPSNGEPAVLVQHVIVCRWPCSSLVTQCPLSLLLSMMYQLLLSMT